MVKPSKTRNLPQLVSENYAKFTTILISKLNFELVSMGRRYDLILNKVYQRTYRKYDVCGIRCSGGGKVVLANSRQNSEHTILYVRMKATATLCGRLIVFIIYAYRQKM